jgi:nucleotide-binding universal stress UspA family protein
MPWKILLPVDGSEGSARAARHVVDIADIVANLEVHVLNIQPLGDDWMVRRSIKPEEFATMTQEWGESSIGPVHAILEAAGVKHSVQVTHGDVARTIARLALDLGCNHIVMGTRGQSALNGLLMGSVATKVLHLTDVPVTLVK